MKCKSLSKKKDSSKQSEFILALGLTKGWMRLCLKKETKYLKK